MHIIIRYLVWILCFEEWKFKFFHHFHFMDFPLPKRFSSFDVGFLFFIQMLVLPSFYFYLFFAVLFGWLVWWPLPAQIINSLLENNPKFFQIKIVSIPFYVFQFLIPKISYRKSVQHRIFLFFMLGHKIFYCQKYIRLWTPKIDLCWI